MEEALLLFDQAAIVVLDAVVQLDALITAVCISNFKLHIFVSEISLFLLSLSRITVMVTGLPSSASWQDLKVCM